MQLYTDKDTVNDLQIKLENSHKMKVAYKTQWIAESEAHVADNDLAKATRASLMSRIGVMSEDRNTQRDLVDKMEADLVLSLLESSKALERADKNLLKCKLQRQEYNRKANAGWFGFYILAVALILLAILS